jgi:SAM-dependent methyltransferase
MAGFPMSSENLRHSKLCIPQPGDTLSEEQAWRWYCNIPVELEQDFLDDIQKNYLFEYYREGGLLRSWRRIYFRHHLSGTFTKMVSFLLMNDEKKPLILDLGCGTGTQSLLCALLGAKVVALDMDSLALEIVRRRTGFYEEHAGRALDISILQSDAFEADYASVAPIDGLYSLFAFNMMQPSSRLLDCLLPHLAPAARMAILDGNNRSWMARLLPWRRRAVWSPREFRRELGQRGFHVVSHQGGAVLPPLFWRFFSHQTGAAIERALTQDWLFPVSHLLLAERRLEAQKAKTRQQ